ncbi:hypothetical protein SAMN04488548_1361006 [Gordonia westfalica]|uniref:Uncharacterized protein n=1 Tax=Gordonia westfalica TaxID=158898 RepID=A0A1H2LXM1_9ACTN|nr:hypothetical protein SAMN04488548_1361006 [Gordonia westfalica]
MLVAGTGFEPATSGL